tara:strand:- start:569 stop:907 length:339 start_codon:yes stop_codon:yes gene_type:complete
MSDIKYPSSNFLKRGHKRAMSKSETAIKEYNSLMEDKTHKSNQTPAYEKNVKHVLNLLLQGADELESENPGEGIYTLIILSLRNNIRLKDKIVDLEQKIKDLNIKIKKENVK